MKKETLGQWLMKKETPAIVLFCIQLTTGILGGTYHAHKIWHEFNLGNRFHGNPPTQIFPMGSATHTNSCKVER